jgi:hypothetical protein
VRKGTATSKVPSVSTSPASVMFEGSQWAKGTDSVNPAGGSAQTTKDSGCRLRGSPRDRPQHLIVISTWVVDRSDDSHSLHRFPRASYVHDRSDVHERFGLSARGALTPPTSPSHRSKRVHSCHAKRIEAPAGAFPALFRATLVAR